MGTILSATHFPNFVTGLRPNLANACVSTEDRDISARDFFKERRYVILKYFRHMKSQKYRNLPSKRVHLRDLVLGEIRSATSRD